MNSTIWHLSSSTIARLRRAAPLLASSAIMALSLTACGSSESDATAASAGAGSGGATGTPDVGKLLASPETCTKPNTICMTMPVPATVDQTPASLQFEIYDSASQPSTPPIGYAGYFTAPKLTAGTTAYVELSDAGMAGDYWMWAIMYMPGGGVGAPVIGVDYYQVSAPAPLHLDGTPLNIADPVMLQK
jgi:hypothetical protein